MHTVHLFLFFSSSRLHLLILQEREKRKRTRTSSPARANRKRWVTTRQVIITVPFLNPSETDRARRMRRKKREKKKKKRLQGSLLCVLSDFFFFFLNEHHGNWAVKNDCALRPRPDRSQSFPIAIRLAEWERTGEIKKRFEIHSRMLFFFSFFFFYILSSHTDNWMPIT